MRAAEVRWWFFLWEFFFLTQSLRSCFFSLCVVKFFPRWNPLYPLAGFPLCHEISTLLLFATLCGRRWVTEEASSPSRRTNPLGAVLRVTKAAERCSPLSLSVSLFSSYPPCKPHTAILPSLSPRYYCVVCGKWKFNTVRRKSYSHSALCV